MSCCHAEGPSCYCVSPKYSILSEVNHVHVTTLPSVKVTRMFVTIQNTMINPEFIKIYAGWRVNHGIQFYCFHSTLGLHLRNYVFLHGTCDSYLLQHHLRC